MPVNVTYPGVYIDELPSQVRTIIGVPTAVAAFVGPAVRGPDNEARHLTSWADFERIYGGLSDTSLMSYAVFHYYQNGGSEAEIVRVVSKDRPAVLDLGNDVKLEAKASGAAGNALRARVEHTTAGDPTVYTVILHPASGADEKFENIKAGAAPNVTDSLEKKLEGSTLVKLADDAKTDTAPEASPPVPAGITDPFADPSPGQPTLFIKATTQRVGAARATIDLGSNVTLTAKYAGAWGKKLRVRVDHDTRPREATDAGDLYNLTIRDMGTGAEESFRNIVADANSPQSLDKVLEGSRLVAPAGGTDLSTRPGKNKDLDRGQDPFENEEESKPAAGAPPAPPPAYDPAQHRYAQAVGGADGDLPTEADYRGSPTAKTGIYALLDTDIFTILCIPPIGLDTTFGQTLTDALKLCVDRRAMLIVDPPPSWSDVDKAVGAARGETGALPITGPDTRNAVVYFPRIKLPDQDGRLGDWPASGAIAGIWARTDGQRGVWKAPAGTDAAVSGVRQLSVTLTDLENGLLNPLGVNCLRTFPVIGTVVWGARTLRGADILADQWKYVPVRRLALYIEESLYRGTQWVVFEPNDEPLWAAIRLNVGAFMNTLFRQGAFQGRTPQEAYLVKCDIENNPQNDIDRGIVNILVGFAPLKPAEFVIIHIQQLAGQLQV
ncbi:MAG: phage tail sheath family protein [Egibacteraceae bacterium]